MTARLMMENLKTLIYRPSELTPYQKALAIQEFERLDAELKEITEIVDSYLNAHKSKTFGYKSEEQVNAEDRMQEWFNKQDN
jgi:hypothetical protein